MGLEEALAGEVEQGRGLQRSNAKAAAGRTSEDVWIPTVCFCCSHGPDLIRVHRVNGVAIELEGNTKGEGLAELAKNQGALCPKAYGVIQKLYNPHRIKAPLKRTNPDKGPGVDPKWVEITWEEALDTIARKLKGIRAEDSQRLLNLGALPQVYTHSGTWSAFFEAFGPTSRLGTGAGLRCEFAQHIFGNLIHGGWSCGPDLTHCNYLLVIGANPLASAGVAGNRQIAEASARGMRMVVVDPVFTLTAGKADEWLPIKPGTDCVVPQSFSDKTMVPK